jgi:hypothetical protein
MSDNNTEKPAKGVRGFILYNPFTGNRWFRIYDPETKGKYTDYKISAEDIQVEILAGGLSLYEGEQGNRLDWASDIFTKKE